MSNDASRQETARVSPEVEKFLLKAQEASEQNAFDVALELTDSVKKYAPDLADVYFLEARIYTRLRQFGRAEAAYDSVLILDPTYKGVRLNLGINAYRQDQYREAIERYLGEADRYPTATVYLEMGRAYLQIGKYDSARTALQKSIELDSTKATTHMWLGKLYQYTGELEKAVRHSRQGLHLDSTKTNYHYLLGTQLLEAGRAEEAVSHLRHVVEHQSWHAGAHHSLGQALVRLGHRNEGEKYLARVDTLQQLEAQIANLRSEAKIYPRQSGRWIKLGDILQSTGRIDEAFEAYTVASTLEPGNIAVQNNLANLSADRGHPEEAISRYRAVLRQDSSQADIWVNLGVVYANTGRYEQARSAWEQALTISPDNSTVRRYLAKLSKLSESSATP
jgi:tetratricopeptide (TPR) repeat protein